MDSVVTTNSVNHLLTNTAVWSPDSQWIVYDIRSSPDGSVFDGTRIERVNVLSGEVQVLYESINGACCGVVTCSPVDDRIVFIHGPEFPTPNWQYAAMRRRGVIVSANQPGVCRNLDARNLAPPFTPGALRGGTHLHVFSSDGAWISFTYEDYILSRFPENGPGHDINQRSVGVSAPFGPVRVPRTHPRNHDGEYFSVLVTRTTSNPQPGSNEISRAFSDAWVGSHGYLRKDRTRQNRAIAFQGTVCSEAGVEVPEVFIVDIPDDLTIPSEGPLEGTETRKPLPPKGTRQRRLTHTTGRKHPGIQGPRHWLRSSPDGARIAFLMRDDQGTVQLWTISPNGGDPIQTTHNVHDISSAFSWHPDGTSIAHVMDTSVCVSDIKTGCTERVTPPCDSAGAPRPEACVFSPDGRKIVYLRSASSGATAYNQICCVDP